MADEQDAMIEQIAARLRPLPKVDAEAKARLLVAVAAERARRREMVARRRPAMVRVAGGVAIAATMAFGAFLIGRDRGAVGSNVPAPVSSGPTAARGDAPSGASLATHQSEDATAIREVQLVFRAPTARRVSVVGDFTGWDPGKAMMTRDSGSGLWSVSLVIPPGRHVYAFLVDDSLWVRDPRAPAAPDVDFGRPGSVLLVGRP